MRFHCCYYWVNLTLRGRADEVLQTFPRPRRDGSRGSAVNRAAYDIVSQSARPNDATESRKRKRTEAIPKRLRRGESRDGLATATGELLPPSIGLIAEFRFRKSEQSAGTSTEIESRRKSSSLGRSHVISIATQAIYLSINRFNSTLPVC